MNAASIVFVSLALLGTPGPPADSSMVAWPAESGYSPATGERPANGPTAACPAEGGTVVFSPVAHAFTRIAADGSVVGRMESVGFAHSCVHLDGGGVAWVDLARRKVSAMDSRGRLVSEIDLPPGLKDVRRILVSGDGGLMIHTAYQETFSVPAGREAGLGEWFASRRDGLVYPDRPELATKAIVRDGVFELRTYAAPVMPAAGDRHDRTFRFASDEPVIAADVLGCDSGGWWIRVTFGRPGEARDAIWRLRADGGSVEVWDLPRQQSLSWSGTFFPDGESLLRLVPTDRGIVIEKRGAR